MKAKRKKIDAITYEITCGDVYFKVQRFDQIGGTWKKVWATPDGKKAKDTLRDWCDWAEKIDKWVNSLPRENQAMIKDLVSGQVQKWEKQCEDYAVENSRLLSAMNL